MMRHIFCSLLPKYRPHIPDNFHLPSIHLQPKPRRIIQYSNLSKTHLSQLESLPRARTLHLGAAISSPTTSPSIFGNLTKTIPSMVGHDTRHGGICERMV